jgi:hypothetical protein
VITGGGTGLTYTPNLNFNGTDTFTYTVSDGNGGTATATVTVTVTPVNDNPTAVADTVTVAEDSGASAISVLANDSSAPDGAETLTIASKTNGTNGTVAITGGGTGLTYTPNANFNGTDTFTYTVSDGNSGTATATVTVTVTPVNDAPTISDIANQTSSGAAIGPVSFTVNDLETPLANLTLTGTSSNTTLVPNANITFGGSGGNRTVTVAPASGQSGSATITVTISDGALTASDTFVVTVTVSTSTPTTTSAPTSSLPSSTYGQSVTLTVSVSSAGGTPTGTVEFFDNGISLGTAPLSGGSASLTTNAIAAGTRSITAKYLGNATYTASTSTATTQTVSKATATSSMTISAVARQYSDLLTYEVTVTGANGEAPAQGVNFKVGTQQMNATPVAFVDMGAGVWKATLANNPLLETAPAGQLKPTGASRLVTATYSAVSPNYTLATPTGKSLLVNKEDARVTYNGAQLYVTGGSSTFNIPLQVTVKDITNTPEANGDTSAGNITLATVSFMNRSTGAIIATVPVDANGVASYSWPVNIGTNASQTFSVGFVVGNYYTRNSLTDNKSITVSKQ